MTPTTLDGMAASALEKFPGLAYQNGGDRASAALDIIRDGEIEFVGNMAMSGDDWWAVGDHYVSIAARRCNCADQRAPVYDGGRLCKHRLAAMFLFKIRKAGIDRVAQLFQDAPDGNVTLRVEVFYLDRGRDYRLVGHHFPGHRWELYRPDERYPLDATVFAALCQRRGWGMSQPPSKQRGYDYNYFLARGGNAPYALGDQAVEVVERARQENVFAQIRAMMEIEREIA